MESLNLLGIVKVFFPLFRHDHKVLPLLIKSLLKESQHLIKYSYFTCFDANIIMLIALSGHSNNQPSDRLTNKCKSRCWMKMIGTAQNDSEMPQFGVKIIEM